MKNLRKLAYFICSLIIFASCSKEEQQSVTPITPQNAQQQLAYGWGLNNWFTWVDIGGRKEPACPPFPKDCFDEVIIRPLGVITDLIDGGNINEPGFYLNYLRENFIEHYDEAEIINQLLESVTKGSLSVSLIAEKSETNLYDKRYLIFQEPGKGIGDDVQNAFQFIIDRGSITE